MYLSSRVITSTFVRPSEYSASLIWDGIAKSLSLIIAEASGVTIIARSIEAVKIDVPAGVGLPTNCDKPSSDNGSIMYVLKTGDRTFNPHNP